MKFVLEIKLDNEAMQTNFDVSEALRKVATKVANGDNLRPGLLSIQDENGNTVGSFGVKRTR